VETHAGENQKCFFFFIFNSLHRFVGFSLLEETTPKKCKLPLILAYNLIEALTLKECKKLFIVSYELIEVPT